MVAPEVCTHASGSVQADVLNLVGDQLLPKALKREGSENSMQEEGQLIRYASGRGARI